LARGRERFGAALGLLLGVAGDGLRLEVLADAGPKLGRAELMSSLPIAQYGFVGNLPSYYGFDRRRARTS
jgi:hypothetical protein